MEIRTTDGLEIDSRAWPIFNSSHNITEDCTFCTLTGIIVGHDGAKGKCPQCNGRGRKTKFEKEKKWRVDEKVIIAGIQMNSSHLVEWKVRDTYSPNEDHCYFIDDYNIFLNKDEAQAVCDERNKRNGKMKQNG